VKVQTLQTVLLLAWRNIFRNKRRTLLTLIAVSIGLWSSISLAAFARGVSAQLARDAVFMLTGHIQLHAKDYVQDPVIEHNFKEDTETLSKVLSDEKIVGITKRVRVPAVVVSERESYGVTLIGIDPSEEKTFSFIGNANIDGAGIQSVDDNGIVLGKKLVSLLQTGLGKRVVVMAQDSNNKIADRGFVVKGIFDEDLEATEKAYVFTGRKVAQKMLSMGENISELSILTDDRESLDGLTKKLKNSFPLLEVHTWRDLSPLVVSLLKMQTGILNFWFLIVIITISFGLMNTIFMAIFERIREIGMLQALGMKPVLIVLQVVAESAFLLFIGAILGNALGLITVDLMSGGVDISRFARGAEVFGLRSIVYPVAQTPDLVSLNLLITIIGFVASLYPALKAASYSPIEAMHKV